MNCPEEEPSSTKNNNRRFEELVRLETLEDKFGRTIQYGTVGDPDGAPIVFFPPLEGTRRLLASLHDSLQRHSLKAVCVNRPGVEGTSWALGKNSSSSSVQNHLDQACEDVLAVLDSLQWNNNVGILCMCAGTPFALAFSAKYGADDRTNGKILSLAPWVLPADCPYSKALNRFAAHYLPRAPISYFVGSISSFFMNHVLSRETLVNKLYSSSSEEEKKGWNEKFKEWPAAEALDWVLGSAEGNTMDVSVCLAPSQELGFDYSKVTGEVVIWIGDKDDMTPVESTNWLADQLGNASVNVIPNGTHNGALFLLGESFAGSLSFLATMPK
jgi:pimeloyl-ACP methyl ester carboxylesterase